MAAQKKIATRRNRRRVGERFEVLVEGTHPESDLLLRGRAASQAPDIDGMIVIADGIAAPGTFVTCEVTEAHPYDLVTRIVDPASARRRVARASIPSFAVARDPRHCA